jgi:hypothetical protein
MVADRAEGLADERGGGLHVTAPSLRCGPVCNASAEQRRACRRHGCETAVLPNALGWDKGPHAPTAPLTVSIYIYIIYYYY